MKNSSTFKLCMTNISGRGGISQNSYCLTTALAKRNLALIYLVPRRYEYNEQTHSFPVMNVFEQLYDKGSLGRKAVAHIHNLFRLQQQLKLCRPQICHLHEVKLPWFDLRLVRWCHRNDIKVVYTAHDILHPELRRKDQSLIKFFIEVDAIIANAKENKMQILDSFKIDQAKIDVIIPGNLMFAGEPYLFNNGDKTKARQKLSLDTELPALLFFGHTREYKGLDILLEAVLDLLQNGHKLNLIIAGEPVEDFSKYQQIIDRYQFSDHIHTFLRYIPENEISNFFLAADVVVLPYRRIYQSGIVHVAYAHARPIIATTVGGLTEVVEHGQSGLLVPPNDYKSLATAIQGLIYDQKLLQNMSNFSYRLAHEKYSWSSIADNTINLYENVLGKQII